jgi:hypothetical protein
VVDFVERSTSDSEFTEIFDGATTVELANASELGVDIDQFPHDVTGVAQGSSLSTLAGNIVLQEFDKEMNSRGITCIRYVDDFVILATSEVKARKAFKAGLAILQADGLSAYSPDDNSGKASIGEASAGFEFLGCKITPGTVQPSPENRRKVIKKVNELFNDGLISLANAKGDLASKQKRFAQTVVSVDNYVQGWAHSFSFCNNVNSFKHLDERLNREYSRFLAEAGGMMSGVSETERRNLAGIRSIAAVVARKSEPPAN